MGRKPNFQERVLVVDDDPTMREFLREFFIERGFIPDVSVDGADAIKKIAEKEYLIVLADLRMPGVDGLELLKHIRENSPEVPVLIITAYGTIDTAISAIRMGAFDFITKPISPEELDVRVEKALEYARLLRANEELRRKLWQEDLRIVGVSRAMQKIIKTVEAVANSKATVLIEGESGTGKELIARALHQKSYRADKPFVKVNCAAIPESLLEAELFGVVQGAYTGANKDRIGKFEAANGGTILLDEISETTFTFQTKLLRVLQEMEFERVGSTKPIKIDVRVIATTNKCLRHEVHRGNFREDLFYRLNVIPIVIPPLRKRKSDIPLLVNYFINKYSIENGKKPFVVEQDAMDFLLEYAWPGNVRELENFIHRAVVVSNTHTLDRKTAMALIKTDEEAEKLTNFTEIPPLYDVEKELILCALERTGGNKTEAANLLGITTRTIYNKIKLYEKEGIKIDKNGKVIRA